MLGWGSGNVFVFGVGVMFLTRGYGVMLFDNGGPYKFAMFARIERKFPQIMKYSQLLKTLNLVNNSIFLLDDLKIVNLIF